MDKLRSEQSRELPPKRLPRQYFQRCDSDPRLSRRHKDAESPNRTLTFASPTRNRIKRTNRKKSDSEKEPGDEVTISVPSVETSSQPLEVERPKRSALAKNVTERRSRSTERRSSIVWNTEESIPFIQRRASFRCAVCDCDIPFTNCVLCSAEAKGAYLPESGASEIFINESELVSLSSEDLLIEGDRITVVELTEEAAQSETKELEEFYDHPTPGTLLKYTTFVSNYIISVAKS